MKVIDTHTHFYPQEWIDLLARDGERQGGKIERTAHGYKVSAGKLNNAFGDEFVSIEARLAGMKRQRVDMQALSLTTPMVYWAPPAFGLALSEAFNDAVSRACRDHPGQFVAFAMVPMQDPALALKELERAAKLEGMRGLYLATSIDGAELDDKRFWDVYAKCEEIGWPVFLHPVYTLGVDRTQRYYLRNLLGNPYDTGMAAACLIFGGVLDAFPKLEVNLPHAGGHAAGIDRAPRSRHEGAPRAQAHEAPAERISAPLHLRHDRPRRSHQQEPRATRRSRSRGAWQRLLLRHGTRRSRRRRRADEPAGRAARLDSRAHGGQTSAHRMKTLAALLVGFALSLPGMAAAQAYPSKPILMIVPLQAGTAVDVVARTVAAKMSERLGQPIVVENQPGAAGQIGTERIARAAPDGYTIGFVNDSILTMLPNLNKVAYDPLRDLAPVSRVAGNSFAMAVNPAFPAKTVGDLIAMAKAEPGKINFASGGNGSPQHMMMEMFKAAAGVDIVHVPYKGAAQALTDVIGGQVPIIAQGIGVVSSQAKSGKVRVIAVTGLQRSALMPDVPTLNESGLPGFEFATWFAVVAPASTPRTIVDRLNAEIVAAANLPEVRAKLTEQGYDVEASSPARLTQSIQDGLARMGKVIRDAGIKAD
jgi:tripartite-type tricarboxylate transporter receptor subunit TctC/predicted TIM-barrel fold metal-dependent hydrolase